MDWRRVGEESRGGKRKKEKKRQNGCTFDFIIILRVFNK